MLPARTKRCWLRVGAVLVLAVGSSPGSSSWERNGWYSERIEWADIVLAAVKRFETGHELVALQSHAFYLILSPRPIVARLIWFLSIFWHINNSTLSYTSTTSGISSGTCVPAKFKTTGSHSSQICYTNVDPAMCMSHESGWKANPTSRILIPRQTYENHPQLLTKCSC